MRLINAANGLQRKGITLRAPCAAIYLMLVVALTGIEEVWVGRVHPPGIGTVVIEFPQIFPETQGTGTCFTAKIILRNF